MFQFIAQALKAKKALENAPSDLPGLKLPGSQQKAALADWRQQTQQGINSMIPQSIHNINDIKYKMRAGLASNLGMPMDTFMSNQDFAQYGMQRPKQFDPGEARMLGILHNLYRG